MLTVHDWPGGYFRLSARRPPALAGGGRVAMGQSMGGTLLVKRRRLGYDTSIADYWDLPRYV